MPEQNLFSDPVFRAETDEGRVALSWPGVLAGLWRGEIHDLPALQLHQRPAVVLHAAIWLGAAARHIADPGDPEALHHLIVGSLGEAAGRVTAPAHEIAFYQPAIANAPPLERWNSKDLDAVDAFFAGVLHETKGIAARDALRVEHAILALIGGTQRIFVKDNPNSALWGLPQITPVNARGSLGFEVRALADIYAEQRPTRWHPDPSFADHIAWARTWDLQAAPLAPDALGWPFVDAARPTRIVADTAGHLGFRQLSTTARLVAPGPADAAAAGSPGDADTPSDACHPGCALEAGAPFRLTKRGFNPRVAHALLFGAATGKTKNVQPAPILNALPEDTVGVRISAVGYDQGKTIGVVDETISITPARRAAAIDPVKLFRREPRAAARIMRDISEAYVSAIGTTRANVLGPALAALYRRAAHRGAVEDDAVLKARIQADRDRFDAAIRTDSLEHTFRLLAERAERDAVERDAAELCTHHARAVVDAAARSRAAVGESGALAAAEARQQLTHRLRTNLWKNNEDRMPREHDERPHLYRHAAALVDQMGRILRNEDDRPKQLRAHRAKEAKPIGFWTLMGEAGVPDAWLEDTASVNALHAICVCMAHIPQVPAPETDEEGNEGEHGRRRRAYHHVGAWLGRAGYAEDRLNQLLKARDDTLVKTVVEVRNVLDTHTATLDWRDPGALLLGDAQGDSETLDQARQGIARQYIRAAHASQPAT